MKKIILLFVFTAITSVSFAGSFYFPLEGHYPYSSNNNIEAVPDLDVRTYYMKSRMNETGDYWNGYKYSDGQIGYKKDGGGDWGFDGVPYVEDETYLYYDNHRGYDFVVPQYTAVHAVEDGTFCGYVATYGQICIQHNLTEGVYQTYYTHMTNIPSSIKNMSYGQTIYRWTKVGEVSNVGASGVHLHFTTYKYDPNHPDYSTRKTPNNNGWIVVDPYGLKDGVGGDDLEPYLWN